MFLALSVISIYLRGVLESMQRLGNKVSNIQGILNVLLCLEHFCVARFRSNCKTTVKILRGKRYLHVQGEGEEEGKGEKNENFSKFFTKEESHYQIVLNHVVLKSDRIFVKLKLIQFQKSVILCEVFVDWKLVLQLDLFCSREMSVIYR